MDDISRRGFLRGLLATAAIPIVAPLIPKSVLAVAAQPEVAAARAAEAGELWIQRPGGLLQLVGMIVEGVMEQEAIETGSPSDLFPNFIHGPVTGRFDLASDLDGRIAVVEALEGRQPVQIAVGHRFGTVTVVAFMRSVEQEFDGAVHRQCIRFDVTSRLGVEKVL